MAKTYTVLTPGNATAGNAILASDHSAAFTNINNLRVPPMCRVYRTSGEATVNATWEVIGSWVEAFDTDSMWTSANNYIEIQTAGVYVVAFSGTWTANGTNDRLSCITLNDSSTGAPTTDKVVCADFCKAIGVTDTGVSATAIRSFAVGDKLRLHVYQNSGGALDFGTAGSGYASMEVAWLGQVS